MMPNFGGQYFPKRGRIERWRTPLNSMRGQDTQGVRFKSCTSHGCCEYRNIAPNQDWVRNGNERPLPVVRNPTFSEFGDCLECPIAQTGFILFFEHDVDSARNAHHQPENLDGNPWR